MSLWSEANEDAKTITPDMAATGARVGFLDAFETSYNTQVRGSAMYGIEKAIYDLDAEQAAHLRGAGVENIPHLSDDAFGFFGSGAFSGDYMDVARFYQDGGDPELAGRLKEYDDKIAEYQTKFPELRLRSSGEMWDEVRTSAQNYERKSATDRNTFGGSVGSLAGGLVGSLNVESDPLNFATLPVGSFGKSIVTRILGQGAGQGIIEGINQFTGVQEQRRLLGLEHGAYDALTRVAGATIGGAALQGVGEGFAAAGRRFFRNAPHDPAPVYSAPSREALPDASAVPEGAIPADPAVAAAKLAQRPQSYMDYLQEVSPWSVSRAGRARTVLDIDNVKAQLDDWAGPSPAFTRSDTAMPLPRSDFTAPANIFERVADTSRVDDIARQVDPDTFRVYDKLADENAAIRAAIADMPMDEGIQKRFGEIEDRIAMLDDKANNSGAMKSKKYRREIAELKAEREDLKEQAVSNDTPDIAEARQRIMRNDEKMRDMAPVVSRAYARARGKWNNAESERNAITKMIRENRKYVGDEQLERVTDSLPASLYDKAPILQQAPKVEATLAKDADAADTALAILADNAKQMDDVLERYRASVARLLGEDGAPEISVEGIKTKLNLDTDKITVPNADGNGTREISLRQLLDEQNEMEADLKAVASCSIR